MVYVPYIVTESVDCKGEVRNITKGGGVKFGQYTEGGTASVACVGDTTKPGYIFFDPGVKYTINWIPTGGQAS